MRAIDIESLHSHTCTVIALHGFNSNAVEFSDKLARWWDMSLLDHTRVVFLMAPLRRISCYNNEWYRSWHDYFTAHGDDGVAREEEIDAANLHETRRYVRGVVERERRLTDRIVLLGESQGACCAIDAGMELEVPVIALYGQRYVHTPLNMRTPIYAFWGGRDTVISAHVAASSLVGANVTATTASTYAHADTGSKLATFLRASMASILRSA